MVNYREFFCVARVGLGGQGRLFRRSLAKIFCRNQARAGREGKGGWGKGIPAPPERKFSEIGVGIFPKKGSDFVQKTQQLLTERTLNLEMRGCAQPAPPKAGLVSLWRRVCLARAAGFPNGSRAKISPQTPPIFTRSAELA